MSQIPIMLECCNHKDAVIDTDEMVQMDGGDDIIHINNQYWHYKCWTAHKLQ